MSTVFLQILGESKQIKPIVDNAVPAVLYMKEKAPQEKERSIPMSSAAFSPAGKVILGSEKDNVVTCCAPIAAGQTVLAGTEAVLAVQDIPIYHKMAIADIPAGSKVYKYGQPIGIASAPIARGQHVHVQNLESDRGRGDRKGGNAK